MRSTPVAGATVAAPLAAAMRLAGGILPLPWAAASPAIALPACAPATRWRAPSGATKVAGPISLTLAPEEVATWNGPRS